MRRPRAPVANGVDKILYRSEIMATPNTSSTPPQQVPSLRVTIGTGSDDLRQFEFRQPFRIGRHEPCDVCINDDFVSRKHVEVTFDNGQWWVRDLQSSNGLYVGDQRVESVPVIGETTIRFGIRGPEAVLRIAQLPPPPPKTIASDASVTGYVRHYFKTGDQPAGEHTMMVRQAFQKVQRKQKWKYWNIIGILMAGTLSVGAYAFYEYRQARQQRALAQDLFYNMKALDLDIANVERLVMDSRNQQGRDEIHKYQNRRKDMEKSYDHFLNTLHVYDRKMTPEERIVLRVARIFGECELAMPPGFADEIQNYIQKWRSSGRLAKDIRLAQEKGYAAKISEELLAQDLPPQFFYLALQESDFDQYASGPMTRKGYAKGMWQFIPETAVRYGLKIGPLVDFRRPDPSDDRHHYDRATKAAARYLKDLYTTDAQASGLLVMACYNWGEGSVLPLVRNMPANPRERNFWRLLSTSRDKLPQETYDYVFYICSAAVIGENPRLFGFDFDNPLAHLESK